VYANLTYPETNYNSDRQELYYDSELDLNIHVFNWIEKYPIPFKIDDIIDVTISKDDDEDTYSHKIIKIENNKIYSAEFYNGEWYRYKMTKLP
jgi:hypothetical protein